MVVYLYFWRNLIFKANKSFENKSGSILCIGFAIGKFYSICRELKIVVNFDNHLKLLIESVGEYHIHGQSACSAALLDFLFLIEIEILIFVFFRIDHLVKSFDDNYLSYSAVVSFGEIARNGDILLPIDDVNRIIDQLQHKIQTSSETNKLKERAALAMSCICVGDKTFRFNEEIIKRLLNSAQTKQVELHMVIGESLINSALGVKSPAARNQWICMESDWKAPTNNIMRDNDYLEWLLDEILEKYIENSNPHLRQAASFWLLILLKKCSNLNDCVLKKIVRIQDSFINRLGENDDLTQEVASKAIGLIYTLADVDQKKDLVAKLVDTLSGNQAKKKTTVKIQNENEELFKDDQLGMHLVSKTKNTNNDMLAIKISFFYLCR
jgi:proteasome component ECM29